jgi:CRISPR-associated protein Cas2
VAFLIVVSYDVADDRRRNHLAAALKDFGARVQYSVFECHLEEPQIDRLRTRLLALLDPQEDRLRLYHFCRDCGAKTEIHGLGVHTDDPDVYVL